MDYKNCICSHKSQRAIYYDPDQIQECYDIYICPGYDVYGNPNEKP